LGEGAGELIAARADLEAKMRLLDMWKEDNAELQVRSRFIVCDQVSRVYPFAGDFRDNLATAS
jgi:hypothetical protein